jgi:hypothetical protein
VSPEKKSKRSKSPMDVAAPSMEIEEAAPEEKKKPLKSPKKLRTSGPEEEDTTKQVTICSIPLDIALRDPNKLLIFNVHRTLLDSSILSDPNPTSKIKITFKTKNRRLTLRPGLPDFLQKCFKTYVVAFWGSKSRIYMDEIVSAMLERVKCPAAIVPAFIWSQKHCEAIQWSDSDVVAWGYPLQSMWKKFPRWNSSNTVIVDHKPQCVNRNPDANVILATPFYVQELTNIGDDGQFLKTSLWPQLRGLFGSAAPADFEKQCPNLRQKEQAQVHYELNYNENISGPDHSLQGEGTCEPPGSTQKLSPHRPLIIITDF